VSRPGGLPAQDDGLRELLARTDSGHPLHRGRHTETSTCPIGQEAARIANRPELLQGLQLNPLLEKE